jgi:hypothetical protein
MIRSLLLAGTLGLALSWPLHLSGQEIAQISTPPFGAFAFEQSVQVPLPPLEAYHRFLDVDAWWDHTFSGNPARFYIEPRPGGGFYEIFDEEGNGVLHATVIFVSEGKMLRMRGPLGFSGYALDLVFTLEFSETEGGTRVDLDLRGMGELEEGWAEAIHGVWYHFLVERYLPYCRGTPGQEQPPR